MHRLVCESLERPPPRRAPLDGCRILPQLPEGVGEVADDRTMKLELHVVPARSLPVVLVHGHRLLVASVALIVATAVTEVDAARECDIVGGPSRATDDEQLLMVTAEQAHPLVEQHLTAGLVDRLGHVKVLLLAEVGLVGM